MPEIRQVGVMGYSLGGSAVVRATALDERIRVVIVESSFSSLAAAVRDSFSQHTGLPSWPLATMVVKAAERELGLSVEQTALVRHGGLDRSHLSWVTLTFGKSVFCLVGCFLLGPVQIVA